MKEMLRRNISSVPVFEQDYDIVPPLDWEDVPVQATLGPRYWLGFADCLDLAAMALQTDLTKTEESLLSKLSRWISLSPSSKQVGKVINLSNADPFYGIRLGNSLVRVIEAMSRGVHRVAIVNPDPEYTDVLQVVGVITQSQIVKLLADNMHALGDMPKLTIGELFEDKLKSKIKVLSANMNVTARHVFELMVTNKFSAIPLVDNDERIVTSMSASDIRSLCKLPKEQWTILDEPAIEFLRQMRTIMDKENPGTFLGAKQIDRALTVNPRDTFGTVLNLIAASRLHRVYVVDSHRKIEAVISLTDVISVIRPRKVVMGSPKPTAKVVTVESQTTEPQSEATSEDKKTM